MILNAEVTDSLDVSYVFEIRARGGASDSGTERSRRTLSRFPRVDRPWSTSKP